MGNKITAPLRSLTLENLRIAQRQYFDRIRSKIAEMRFRLETKPDDKVLIFLINLMERAIATKEDKCGKTFILRKLMNDGRSSQMLNAKHKKQQVHQFDDMFLSKWPLYANI